MNRCFHRVLIEITDDNCPGEAQVEKTVGKSFCLRELAGAVCVRQQGNLPGFSRYPFETTSRIAYQFEDMLLRQNRSAGNAEQCGGTFRTMNGCRIQWFSNYCNGYHPDDESRALRNYRFDI